MGGVGLTPSHRRTGGFGSIRAVPADRAVDIPRVAHAPRLIEWTGERCVPWAPDVQVVYEHLHRYLWAVDLVHGRRVLDLASGEGFGAALLAGSAEAVVGVDFDERTVQHSRLNYALPNLSFEVADARDLSRFEDGGFGAVIAFEMIEHVLEHERVLEEIRRILAPDGLLVMSTPDRRRYAVASGANPFHLRELDQVEFAQLLGSQFANVEMWGQRTVSGSALGRLDPGRRAAVGGSPSFFIERTRDEWRIAPGITPAFLVGVASNAELPSMLEGSALHDGGIELVRSAEAAAEERAMLQMQEEFAPELAELRERVVRDSHTISSLGEALKTEHRRRMQVEASVTWRLLERTRARVFAALGGETSKPVAALQFALRLIGRLLGEPARSSNTGGAVDQADPPSRR